MYTMNITNFGDKIMRTLIILLCLSFFVVQCGESKEEKAKKLAEQKIEVEKIVKAELEKKEKEQRDKEINQIEKEIEEESRLRKKFEEQDKLKALQKEKLIAYKKNYKPMYKDDLDLKMELNFDKKSIKLQYENVINNFGALQKKQIMFDFQKMDQIAKKYNCDSYLQMLDITDKYYNLFINSEYEKSFNLLKEKKIDHTKYSSMLVEVDKLLEATIKDQKK